MDFTQWGPGRWRGRQDGERRRDPERTKWRRYVKSPNEESPNEESPNEESPNEESPNEESPNEESPKEKVRIT